MTHIHPFRLFVFLLLCCTRVITFAQSDSYQTIPESLRGYWQYKTENVSVADRVREVRYTGGIGSGGALEKQRTSIEGRDL